MHTKITKATNKQNHKVVPLLLVFATHVTQHVLISWARDLVLRTFSTSFSASTQHSQQVASLRIVHFFISTNVPAFASDVRLMLVMVTSTVTSALFVRSLKCLFGFLRIFFMRFQTVSYTELHSAPNLGSAANIQYSPKDTLNVFVRTQESSLVA